MDINKRLIGRTMVVLPFEYWLSYIWRINIQHTKLETHMVKPKSWIIQLCREMFLYWTPHDPRIIIVEIPNFGPRFWVHHVSVSAVPWIISADPATKHSKSSERQTILRNWSCSNSSQWFTKILHKVRNLDGETRMTGATNNTRTLA